MATRDIQEMLEGMLNDEQTAEVLHLLSVSPEKLTAFRQHMALRGSIEQDARLGGLNDDEDDAVWAAVLGATGGLVTGGAAVGASGWLAKATAFVVTGLAGFFIGTTIDGNLSSNNSESEPTLAQHSTTEQILETSPQTTPSLSSVASERIDTVVQTVIEYRDRIKYKYIEREPSSNEQLAATEQSRNRTTSETTQTSTTTVSSSQQGHSIAQAQTPPTTLNRYGISQDAIAALQHLALNTDVVTPNAKKTSDGITDKTVQANNTLPIREVKSADANDSFAEPLDPNNPNLELDANRSPNKEEVPELEKTSSLLSLMRDGFEVGYNERLGRITPPPTVRDESEPNFGGRSIDLTWRALNGRTGLGARLIYGTFSTVKLSEQVWDGLRVADTLLVPSLESSQEFNVEVFANYRLPLFNDRFALSLEGSFGLSSTRLKVGGDLSALYLITDWLGAQGGIGYGGYRYTTQQERESALENYENAAITDDFIDSYSGTMLEGRYGLFFRF